MAFQKIGIDSRCHGMDQEFDTDKSGVQETTSLYRKGKLAD
tara:strand:+ start:427 stop:549 length:123 start_codon:yes stop_codon:yes gene_type:complete